MKVSPQFGALDLAFTETPFKTVYNPTPEQMPALYEAVNEALPSGYTCLAPAGEDTYGHGVVLNARELADYNAAKAEGKDNNTALREAAGSSTDIRRVLYSHKDGQFQLKTDVAKLVREAFNL